MLKKSMIIGLVMCALLPLAALAELDNGGLKSNYSKIFVQNLPIGQTISMKQLANAPLMIGNNFDVPIYVTFKTEIPKKPRDGFMAIPNAGWVQVESAGVTLLAKGKALLDVTITIPDDEKLFEQKYQCDIVMHTQGNPNVQGLRFGFQITGLLLFSIAPGRNEIALQQALNDPADAAYKLEPPQVDIWGVKPGSKIKVLTKEKKEVVLTNRSKKTQKYLLSSVDPGDTTFKPYTGSQFSGDPDQVIIKQDEFKISPGKSRKLKLEVQVPQDVDFTKGPLVYLVLVKSGTRQGVGRYMAIYCYADKKPEPKEGK